VWLSGRCIFSIYLGFGSRPFGSLRFKPLPAPPLAAVILATDVAEYMGLIIVLHMLTGAAGSGGCICLDRRGPLGVAFRQTGPFREGCRAAVALSFVVELWLVRPPLWEAALPRLPEGRGGGGGRSGGRHKAARPASAFAPHPRDGQEDPHVADLG
jgi:hypothetical protein